MNTETLTRKLVALLAVVLAVAGRPSAQAGKGAAGAERDFVAPGPIVPLTGPAAAVVSGIGLDRLAAHVYLLAAPALEGRGLGGQGLDAALDYAAGGLALAGIPPLGPPGARPLDAYSQAVPLRMYTEASRQLTVGPGTTGQRTFGEADCAFPPIAPQALAAPVAFAAYGIQEPSLARDDLRGLDLAGKIVVIIGGLPPGERWRTRELVARYGAPSGRARYEAKLRALARAGARAVLVLEPDEAVRREDAADPTYFRPFEALAEAPEPPLVCVSRAVVDAILSSAGGAGTAVETLGPRPLAGVSATIRIAAREQPISSRNVIGAIAGSDAALRERAVVIGAHIDHLGRRGDAILPGADDNASGVAALLEIGRAIVASGQRPKRTLVFAVWTGEEEGKLGSGHYVRHPLWPLDRTDVYLNLDMIGHPWTREEIAKAVNDAGLEDAAEFLRTVTAADFVEPGVAQWAPELCPFLARAARARGLALHFDRTDGVNGGSDYRDFARAKVPFIRFFGNYFPGYHQASDTRDALDIAQVQKLAQLAAATAWLLADR